MKFQVNAARGLVGEMHHTPWFMALGVGLALVVFAAGFVFLARKFSRSMDSPDGCLVLLFGCVGFVFGVCGFVCVCLGLFGWF